MGILGKEERKKGAETYVYINKQWLRTSQIWGEVKKI